MLKNLNTFKLIIILLVLVLVYLGFNFLGNKNRSKSFHEELVSLDTAKVDKLVIEKGNESLELKKENGNWLVKLKDGQYKKATTSSVKGTIQTLESIKPSRIVSRSKDKWSEYQVDTSGTKVMAFADGKKVLDLIIGRLNFKDQRSYYTYVRLADEEDTYVSDNFMSFSINTNSSGYRDKLLARVKKDSVTSVQFDYPDSSFILSKENSGWTINGTKTDSASTAKYFSSLGYLNGNTFYDENLPSIEPPFKVIINRKSEDDIVLNGWRTGNENIITSSENSENAFTGNDLFNKIFVGESNFFESTE